LTINLYVNKEFKEFMDQLLVVSQANNQPLSTAICQAVKKYMLDLNDEKELIGDKKDWDNFIKNADKEELYAMSRVICGINDRIVRKVCQ
jgi:hypothetical protein